MKVLLIGNPIAEEEYNKLNNKKYISYADNRVQLSVIKGLYNRYKEDVVVLSPLRTNKKIDLHGAKTIYFNCVLNNSITYYLSILFNITINALKLAKRWKYEKIVIITSNPHIYYALPSIILKKIHKAIFVPFLVGAIELPEYKGIFSLVSKMSKYIMKNADATIAYVEKSALDYTNKPYCLIYYCLTEKQINLSNRLLKQKKIKRIKNKINISYTGSLTNINGIDYLIKLIDSLPDNYVLHICGKGPRSKEIIEYQKRKPEKLIYYGEMQNYEVMKLQYNSDVLILIRPDDNYINNYYSKYAASGKLIEYLLSGTPIITNYVESINEDLKGFLNYFNFKNIDDSTKKIINFTKSINNRDVIKKSQEGRTFVLKKAIESYQNNKICDFIDELLKGEIK